MRLFLFIVFGSSWFLYLSVAVQARSTDLNYSNQLRTACPVTPWSSQLMSVQVKGLIIPHHQVSQAVWSQAVAQLARQKPSIIYLLSPNHSDLGPLLMATSSELGTKSSRSKYRSSYSRLLQINSIQDNQSQVMADQGVTVPLTVIRQYLPRTPVIPIIFRKQTPLATLQNLSRYLSQVDNQAVIVASLDFSHDLSAEEASDADQKTINLIRQRSWQETMSLNSDQIDGPTALTALGLTMDKWHAQPQLVWQGHAGQFLGDCAGQTTTYQIWTFSQ